MRAHAWTSTAATTLGFVAVWFAFSQGYPPDLWPGPAHVLRALWALAEEHLLAPHIFASLGRMLTGYLFAIAAAVPLGFVLGTWSRGHVALDPLLQVLRPISPIAWFPLAVLWFGVGDRPAVFIIALATFFPVFMTTVNAVRAVPSNYLRLARNFGATRPFLFTAVLIPAAVPQVVAGLRIGLGISWVNLVAGEMLGAQSGLGYLIVDARNSLRTDRIVAVMLLIGMLGLVLDRFMSALVKAVPGARG